MVLPLTYFGYVSVSSSDEVNGSDHISHAVFSMPRNILPCAGAGWKRSYSTFINVMIYLNLVFSQQSVHLVLLNLVFPCTESLAATACLWVFFLWVQLYRAASLHMLASGTEGFSVHVQVSTQALLSLTGHLQDAEYCHYSTGPLACHPGPWFICTIWQRSSHS